MEMIGGRWRIIMGLLSVTCGVFSGRHGDDRRPLEDHHRPAVSDVWCVLPADMEMIGGRWRIIMGLLSVDVWCVLRQTWR